MAYYAVFSLFPLLLVLIAVGSLVLESQPAQREVLVSVTEAFPFSQGLIERNIERLLALRGPGGLAGILGWLWSASGVFTTLAYNVNRAWPAAEARNFLERRLVALGMVAALVGLLALSLISTTALGLLHLFDVPLWGNVSVYETRLWALSSKLIPWLFTFLMFLALYRWVPNTDVRWRPALWGALVAAVAWELAKNGFAWYLGSGWADYQVVYGSLATVIVLMFWVYISGLIVLLGAHLSAAIARRADSRKGP
jgi:membrane protein